MNAIPGFADAAADAPAPARLPPDAERRIHAENIRTVYLYTPATALLSLAIGALIVWTMWGAAPTTVILGWAAALLLHQSVRIFQYVAYLRADPGIEASERWGRRYLYAVAAAGLIWGSAGVLFFVPGSHEHQAFICLVLFGVATGSMVSVSPYPAAFFTIVPLTLGPVILRLLMEGDKPHLVLALPGIFILAAILGFGWRISVVIRRGKLRRYENLALIEELSREKRLAEEARSAADNARAQAEAANRSKTQFFAAASHDLRQPLHAMGLFAAALSEKVRDPEVVDVVNSINASVDALEQLLNELLDISKIDAGVVKVSPSSFAVQNVFDRLRMDLEPEAFEKELRLRFVPTRAFAHSDPIHVERILRNLVANAIRYTRRGGIVVGCRRRRGALSLEVWDTGIGIPTGEQARVFDEFYQVANPERDRRKGLGLGLSIVQRLSTLLGSAVTLASRSGRGTVFRFTIPAGTRPKQVAAGPAAEKPGARDLSGATIVVVEDEHQVREGMRVLLSGWGAAVLACATIEEALEAGQAGQAPDLIIADYRLREGKTGVEAIDALRGRFGRDIPAVIITGSTMPVHLDEAKVKGFHLLLKPVMPAKLRTLIHFKLRQAA